MISKLLTWLVDVEDGKEKLDIVFELCQRMIDNAGVPMKLYKTLDRREALKDADFVTTQLRVGQLPARELDERIPLSHGYHLVRNQRRGRSV